MTPQTPTDRRRTTVNTETPTIPQYGKSMDPATVDAVRRFWAEIKARWQAEALREAGQDLPGEWSKQDRRKVERWLRSRPYRLAAEGGADRG